MWAENILAKAGDHPLKPRVILCAHTGKASSLIGKKFKIHEFLFNLNFMT